jgi:dienelactone hydrolase
MREERGRRPRYFLLAMTHWMILRKGVARLICASLLALVMVSVAAATPERVLIPPDSLSLSRAPLPGFLFTPAGAGAHPAVVMMHGCGGAYSRNGSLNPRHLMWGEFLASQGYLGLILDSFTPRGINEICTQKYGERALKEADRVGDAYAALAWLRGRSDVDAARIGILGWSHGGGSVLATITEPPASGPGFAAAVSFYPGCTRSARAPQKFRPYAPLLVLIGEADDWTPAAPCMALAAAVAARGDSMQIVTYANTYHDFDNPGITGKRVRKDVPNGVHPGNGVTTAPNPEAREDARKRVAIFLREMGSRE